MRVTRLLLAAACASLAGLAVVAVKLATDVSVMSGPLLAGSAATAAPAPPRYLKGAKACLAEAVYFETKGTSLKAGQAVAHVVLNRREHEEFPESVCAVVKDGCQFSYQCDGEPERMADLEERERALRAAETVLEGQVDDPTDGALYFRAGSASVDWFDTLDQTAEIGGNIFYR